MRPWCCACIQASRSLHSLAFSATRPWITALTASDPSFGGLTADGSVERSSGDSGKSAGLRARSIASSRISSDQKGFQLAGLRTTGGPDGRATTPSEGGTSSMALRPLDSGVFSDPTPSLMASKAEPKQALWLAPWAHNPQKRKTLFVFFQQRKGLQMCINRELFKLTTTTKSMCWRFDY